MKILVQNYSRCLISISLLYMFLKRSQGKAATFISQRTNSYPPEDANETIGTNEMFPTTSQGNQWTCSNTYPIIWFPTLGTKLLVPIHVYNDPLLHYKISNNLVPVGCCREHVLGTHEKGWFGSLQHPKEKQPHIQVKVANIPREPMKMIWQFISPRRSQWNQIVKRWK